MNWQDFFRGDNNEPSMTRLLCFLSFPFSTYVLMIDPTDTKFGLYIGTYAASYLGGKISDMMGKPKASAVNVANVESVNVNPKVKNVKSSKSAK